MEAWGAIRAGFALTESPPVSSPAKSGRSSNPQTFVPGTASVLPDVQGLLDAPISPEVGLGRLRQLLGERNRKHPISPEVGLGRLRQLLGERNRKHPISPEVGLGRLRHLLSERNRKHPISRGMTRR